MFDYNLIPAEFPYLNPSCQHLLAILLNLKATQQDQGIYLLSASNTFMGTLKH